MKRKLWEVIVPAALFLVSLILFKKSEDLCAEQGNTFCLVLIFFGIIAIFVGLLLNAWSTERFQKT